MGIPSLPFESVKLDDLLLDPNNPRFVENLRLGQPIPDNKVAAEQDRISEKFRDSTDEAADDDGADESFFGIQELMDSMRTIGFVPIDRIVVRKLDGKSKKYLVLEGNRRVAAAKRLRDRNKAEPNPSKKLPEDILKSLETVEALLLPTDGLSKDEIDERIGIILGLRHYGAVLAWSPMAKAVNVYREYMRTPPKMSAFEYSVKHVSSVANRLSISRGEVKKALKTYIVFEQLNESFPAAPPEPKYYSLIEAFVTNQKLAKHYIKQDDTTFKLSEGSLEKVYALCQFDKRESPDVVKILPEPKSVAGFARIVEDSVGHSEAAVKDFAKNLLAQVESGERSLDDAVDNLTSFKSVRKWVEGLQKLLRKQADPDDGLDPKDFEAVGNERVYLEELQRVFATIRKSLEV